VEWIAGRAGSYFSSFSSKIFQFLEVPGLNHVYDVAEAELIKIFSHPQAIFIDTSKFKDIICSSPY
jgi:hypothetical protein